MTTVNQKRQQQKQRIIDQLQCFYGPMIALRAEVLNKLHVQQKLNTAAVATWSELASINRDSEKSSQHSGDRFPDFEQILNEGNRQLETYILPRYQKMMNCSLHNGTS